MTFWKKGFRGNEVGRKQRSEKKIWKEKIQREYPALITIGLVVYSKIRYPHPEMFEKAEEDHREFRFEKPFVFYMAAICMFAFGFHTPCG